MKRADFLDDIKADPLPNVSIDAMDTSTPMLLRQRLRNGKFNVW